MSKPSLPCSSTNAANSRRETLLSIVYVIFYWSINALQYCINFCCTAASISHMYTYLISTLVISFPHPPSAHPAPLGHLRALRWAQHLPTSYLCHTGRYAQSVLISQLTPPSASAHCVHESVCYACVSIPALELDSFAPFSVFYVHLLTYRL